MTAYLNQIATAVPEHDVHEAFVQFATGMLQDRRTRILFQRMASRSAIHGRFSCMMAAQDPGGVSVDADHIFKRGGFPGTAIRMALFERHARVLLRRTLDRLDLSRSGIAAVTHVLVTTCTGFYAPGLDFDIVDHLGIDPSVERAVIGFMGCYAAINALKTARHIVRSEPDATVLIVNLELCTIHLQETQNLEQVLSFLLFGDGCAASIVSAQPHGLALDRFKAMRLPGTAGLITWRIGDMGFEMLLSGRVPAEIGLALKNSGVDVIDGRGAEAIDLWAVHPGGRSILDAVEHGLGLSKEALVHSRDILARYGNMSSATIMFVLQTIMAAAQPGQTGCAMSFGPGVTAETMLFHAA